MYDYEKSQYKAAKDILTPFIDNHFDEIGVELMKELAEGERKVLRIISDLEKKLVKYEETEDA